MISAAEALQIGMVNSVFSMEELLPEVRKTAQLIASKGRVSLRAAKDAINLGRNVDLHSGLAIERDAFALCISSPDAKEGTQAFLEKRKAEFTGTLSGE
jgi:enoyl-CoA hydratase